MLARAYSFIELKSFEDDQRIIRGIASTPSPDRVKDRVNPMGAKFELPIPFLWQHRHSEPVGHVIEAKLTETGIPFVAQLAKTDEPGKLKDRLDEAWQSLKLRLVRAVSIGFNPTKWSFLDDGGVDFDEWDWLELSGVTIPANPEAVISDVKQFDKIYREAEGIPDFALPQIPVPPVPAASGKKARVVRLDAPARARATPFVVRKINPIKRAAG